MMRGEGVVSRAHEHKMEKHTLLNFFAGDSNNRCQQGRESVSLAYLKEDESVRTADRAGATAARRG
jgi:hypothetical protein